MIPALGRNQMIAVGGKTSRRTTTKTAAAPLHMVSSFAAEVGVVLGQTATAEKSNEITAIPELLRTLDVTGCIVTIDAMGTRTAIGRTIRERGGDYVLCVKHNHPKLLDSILLAHAGVGEPLRAVTTCETRSRGHGHEEVRRCWAFEVGKRLYKTGQWRDLGSFVVIERTCTVGGKTTVERRHYISSLPPDADRIARAVRTHWEVENRLHWCLDVQFGDDYARARTGHVAHNLALVRHIALNLIRLDTSHKASIKTKRLLTSACDEFRAELLGFDPAVEDDDDYCHMRRCGSPAGPTCL